MDTPSAHVDSLYTQETLLSAQMTLYLHMLILHMHKWTPYQLMLKSISQMNTLSAHVKFSIHTSSTPIHTNDTLSAQVILLSAHVHSLYTQAALLCTCRNHICTSLHPIHTNGNPIFTTRHPFAQASHSCCNH